MTRQLTANVAIEAVGRSGRVALVTIDSPPVNALSHGVRDGLARAMQEVLANADIAAAVIVCAGATFSCGADIRELGQPMRQPQLAEVLAALENAAKPVIAAIHGKALGGGLELALACHYRIAATGASFAFPEIKLGIIPGCGGTQRLPRLAGLETTIALAAEGQQLDAAQALEAGILDAVLDGDLHAAAVDFAERLLADDKGPRPTRALPLPPRGDALLEASRSRLAKRRRLEPAPRVALEVIAEAYEQPFDKALENEYAKCVELLRSPESRALRHLFAAERVVKRPPDDVSPGTQAREISCVAVVGPGGMGCGIALVFAQAGFGVTLCGRDAAHAARGKQKVAGILERDVKRGRMSAEQRDDCLSRLTPAALDDEVLAAVDLVIEAASETLETKLEVFKKLGAKTRPGTILATNTSYLDIDALAAASGRPADVCGMHFFTPAHRMRLLENVRGAATAPDVLATVTAIAGRIGKLPVLAGMCEGFIVNRLLGKRSREGYFMLEEGARPEQIDRVLTDFGFPMGLYTLSDLAGINLQYAARQARLAGMSEREKAADFVDQLYALGRYGQKTGAGWYVYDEQRKPTPDPAIATLLDEHAARRGIAQREFGNEEILQRCIFAMVNEAARMLEEGAAARPQDIDVAMVHGVGFPKTTGGPLWWAGEIGLAKVREAMLRFADTVGAEYWTPSPLVERLAAAGKTFYDT